MSDPQSITSDAAQRPTGPLTADQVQSWAGLIVSGQGDLPADLTLPDRDRLAVVVRALLAERLLDLIVAAVARDLLRRSRPDKEVSP